MALVPITCVLEEHRGCDLLQHLLLLLHLEGGADQVLRPGPRPQRSSQHPAAEEVALGHLHQLRIHQHPPLPDPEGDLRHLRGDHLWQGVSSRDVHAGQRGEQEDLHGSPDVSLHCQPVQHLLVLQGKSYIFDHKGLVLLKVRLYLRGICPNQQMSSLGKLIIIPWPYGYDEKYNIVMSSHLMSTTF